MFPLLTRNKTPILSSDSLQISRQHLNTRKGLGEGMGDAASLLTPASRQCTSPSSVNSPLPLEHGFDLHTCCGDLHRLRRRAAVGWYRSAAITFHILSIWVLEVLASFPCCFGLSESEEVGSCGAFISKSSLAVSPHHGSWSPASRSAALPLTHATSSAPASDACCPRPDPTQRSWERILKIYIPLLQSKQKTSRSKSLWEGFLSFTFIITTRYNSLSFEQSAIILSFHQLSQKFNR